MKNVAVVAPNRGFFKERGRWVRRTMIKICSKFRGHRLKGVEAKPDGNYVSWRLDANLVSR